MTRIVLSVVLPLFVSVAVSGQVTTGALDSLVRQTQNDMTDISDARRQEFADDLEAYLEFERQLKAEYDEYCQKVMEQWGDNAMVESSQKVWVEYGENDSSRTVVDFETGKVTVEVLADENESEADADAMLVQALRNLMTSRGRTIGFNSALAKDEPISDFPIMEGQLDLSKYQVAGNRPAATASAGPKVDPSLGKGGKLSISRTPASAGSSNGTMAQKAEQRREELARQERERQEKLEREREARAMTGVDAVADAIVSAGKPESKSVDTPAGKKKILKIELQLVEDHIPKRAEQFKELVSANSGKFSVDEPLIYAIMEQESAFNPAAKSHVPAYGLMQLVPRSGGRDSYRYVFKVDKVPTADYLFNPANNIELGTAYLRLLMTTSFANVKDSRCRMLCAIAAYNTGAGNVSRAFTGDTNISKAIPRINSMAYDELYGHLKKYLPHGETRDYIQKVTGKMQKYIKK